MALVKRDSGTLVAVKPAKKVKTETVPGTSPYVLPTKKTEPADELIAYITLLFGEKKIGKTSMLAESGDGTFFAFFEPGGKSLSLFGDVFPNWSRFKAAVAQMVATKRFNHVVIDTIDRAYLASERYTYKKLSIEHASDESYGKGWAAVRTDFEEPIMTLVNNGIAVTFVSHAEEREIKPKGGVAYDKIMPTMSKQARSLVESLVDIWAYYGYDGADRILTIQGDDHLGAGHRLTRNFRSPAGVPIRTIHMGASPADAWQNFNDAFHNRYVPPKKQEATETAAFVPRKTIIRKLVKRS